MTSSTSSPTVLLLRDGDDDGATPDAVPEARRRARIVTASREDDDAVARLVEEGVAVAVVGVGAAGRAAVVASARLGAARLALVAVPAPATPAETTELAALLAGVSAKVLLLNGQRDPRAAHRDATWFKDHLASARIEMVPASRLVEGRLTLEAVWDRVLQHAGAPLQG